jgi:hypothetical protein
VVSASARCLRAGMHTAGQKLEKGLSRAQIRPARVCTRYAPASARTRDEKMKEDMLSEKIFLSRNQQADNGVLRRAFF